VLVHYSSRLGSPAAALAAELLCGDGVSTKYTLERGEALHRCDGVMSHSFKCSCLSGYDSALKLLSTTRDDWNGEREMGDFWFLHGLLVMFSLWIVSVTRAVHLLPTSEMRKSPSGSMSGIGLITTVDPAKAACHTYGTYPAAFIREIVRAKVGSCIIPSATFFRLRT
jgi:hypothetical protein